MKSKKQIERRLKAEQAACKVDPSLNNNDFVQGLIWAYEWVLNKKKEG